MPTTPRARRPAARRREPLASGPRPAARGRPAARAALALAVAAPCAGGAGALGCARSGPEAATLAFQGFQQDAETGVFLNETLVFHFSDAVDPSSVTGASLRIVDAEGVPARGRIEVAESKVRFLPDLPRDPSLADAGLAPGATYDVEIAGFPRVDGLRGIDGEPLEATWRGRFATVTPDPALELPVFDDPILDRAPTLEPPEAEISIAPTDPLRLVCAEPVDPRTLSSEGIELRRLVPASVEGAGARQDRIDRFRASLVENARSGAVIELRPLGDDDVPVSLVPGEHHLWIDPVRFALRDLGGHAVLPGWRFAMHPTLRIQVRPRDATRALGRRSLEFTSPSQRSPAPVAGADGTAHWDRTGRVEVRFPRAAGTGRDGAVELVGPLRPADVHATAARVPPGSVALVADGGARILRAQRAIHVEGRLVRSAAATVAGDLAPHGTDLSTWIERVAAADAGWTVLVAGGDLVVSGEIDVQGPLLLAAGGWIRVSGRVRASEVWQLGLGGGRDLQPPAQRADLVLDAPASNPLVEPLHLAALSAPIRPSSGLRRWLEARAVGYSGRGAWQVRYLGERDAAGREVEIVGPVDDPVLLEDCDALRVRLDLTVAPARLPNEPWDPPFVDSVELAWERLAAR